MVKRLPRDTRTAPNPSLTAGGLCLPLLLWSCKSHPTSLPPPHHFNRWHRNPPVWPQKWPRAIRGSQLGSGPLGMPPRRALTLAGPKGTRRGKLSARLWLRFLPLCFYSHTRPWSRGPPRAQGTARPPSAPAPAAPHRRGHLRPPPPYGRPAQLPGPLGSGAEVKAGGEAAEEGPSRPGQGKRSLAGRAVTSARLFSRLGGCVAVGQRVMRTAKLDSTVFLPPGPGPSPVHPGLSGAAPRRGP